MGKRTTGRRLAMQVLFQLDTGQSDPEKIFQDFLTEEPSSEEARAFARELVRGVWKNLKKIDKKIGDCAIDWKLERFGRLDKAILRLAAYELLFNKDLSPAIVINEALELAHRYSDDQAGPFINGILDRISKGGRRPVRQAKRLKKTAAAKARSPQKRKKS